MRKHPSTPLTKPIVYLPMTADLFHVGHLDAIRHCQKYGQVIVGLLTNKALAGYKEVIIPFKQRAEILAAVGVKAVPQNSLNCYDNLIKYHADYCASGDGFEPEELEAIRRAGCKPLSFPYSLRQSTTAIKKKILSLYREAK